MQTDRGFAAGLGVALLAIAIDASACKPTINFLSPSNYELIRTTPRIVLARAIDTERGCRTRFALMEAFKGSVPAEELVLEGCSGKRQGVVKPSREDDFAEARGSEFGSCIRITYEIGQEYVLLLVPEGKSWAVRMVAGARVNEPVAGREWPWALAVQRYVDVAKLGDYEQEKRALKDLQARARTGTDPSVPAAMAGDIERHFAAVSNDKSYADLLAIYENSSDKDVRHRVLWAWANRGDAEANPVFEALLASGRIDSVVAAYFEKRRDTGKLRAFADAFLAAPKTPEGWWQRVAPLGAVLGLADDRHADLVVALYPDAGSNEQHMIVGWLVKHPSPIAQDVLRRAVARRYVERSGSAIALAASGDAEVVDWAREFARTQDENRWVAMYVLAHSPLSEADAFVGELIARSDPGLVSLVQAYADSVNPHGAARLRQIVALEGKSAELDGWLWKTLEQLREEGRSEEAGELLKMLPEDAGKYFDE